jgi:hypothetical protein
VVGRVVANCWASVSVQGLSWLMEMTLSWVLTLLIKEQDSKQMVEDCKNNGVIQKMLGPALHAVNYFQGTFHLSLLAVIQSSTFESWL